MEVHLLFLLCAVCVLGIRAQTKERQDSTEDNNADEISPVFRFARHYEDHMVLQRSPRRSVIWGFGELGRKVLLTVNSAENHTATVSPGPAGSSIWKVTLSEREAGGPFTITAASESDGETNTISLKDVYFGDVWICGGQSNMQFTLNMAFRGKEEAAIAGNYPLIRLFTVQRLPSSKPLYDFKSANILQHWSTASNVSTYGPTWQYFSAVCWIFGRKMYDKFKVPVGLISSNYGGTSVKVWSSPEALSSCGISADDGTNRDAYLPYGKAPAPTQLSSLWNAMISPLLNTTIFGVIWYQAEQDDHEPVMYKCMFPAMVADWRRKWHQGTGQTEEIFPFGFVQLCDHAKNMTYIGTFPEMRWVQTAGYGYVPNEKLPNTFMAVTIDLPDPVSPFAAIHPRDKTDVAQRLYLGALATAYKEKVSWTGPIVESVVVSQVALGYHGAVVTYKESSLGEDILEVRKKEGFEVLLTKESSSMWQSVSISDYGRNYVSLLIPVEVGQKVESVRYEWRDYPCLMKKCAIYSKDSQLPSPPFIANVTTIKRSFDADVVPNRDLL